AQATSTAADAGISFSSHSLDFGNVPVETLSSPQVVTLTNSGGADLVVSSISRAGQNARDFAFTTTCAAAPIAPNATCTISVETRPREASPRSGELKIADNADDSPQTIALAVTGEKASNQSVPAA